MDDFRHDSTILLRVRVMTFNTLFGGEDRFSRILDLLRTASPDVLALQECLGWEDGSRLGLVAAAIAAPYTHLGRATPRGSGRRFHVALVSRRPLEAVRTHADPAHLGHAVVEAIIDGVHVLGAHFDAHGEEPRLREAAYVNALVDLTKPTLLAGDLNALSRRDPYPADLAERLRRAGVDKYGHPPRFDAIGTLESMGWIDARPDHAWVTARRDRGGVQIDYRTDYVFCSPPMAARLERAWVLPADGASDHDAVIADFLDA